MNKNQFAPLPPMGWNSYDYYDTAVDEAAVRANADFMAKNLKSFGWEYIVVDIQWYAHGAGSMRKTFQYIPFSELEMDEYSRLLPDPERFPSSVNGAGFQPLADYIHSLGLKFGIHIMRGIPRLAAHQHSKIKNCAVTANLAADPSSICRWNPDMYGLRDTAAGQAYYDSLLELYASWGVDFIKCDDICNTNNWSQFEEGAYAGRHEIEMLANAIKRCGRKIVLSLSPGPALITKAWHYETYANMWRITDDFWDHWDALKAMFARCELWQNHVSAGCFPDCDMLPLGKLGKGFGEERDTNFTRAEQRTMMSLWCLFGSPLMLGAELTKLDEWTLSLLTNSAVLNLLNPAYRPHQILRTDTQAIWTASRQEAPGCTDPAETEIYAALFNLSEEETVISIPFDALGVEQTASGSIQITDLWEKQTHTYTGTELSISVPAHGCLLCSVQPTAK